MPIARARRLGRPMADSIWPEGRRAGFALTFDVDAESAILAVDVRYAGGLTTMSHQAYGPKVGVPGSCGC